MRRILLVLSGLLAVGTPVMARDTYTRQPGVDAEHYVFRLTLSDTTNDIVGETTVSMRFSRAGLTSFFLDLTSVARGNGMTVTGVTEDTARARFTHVNNRLTITLPRATRTGELRRFTIHYHGVPGDGLRMGTNKSNERCFFSWNWPDKARQWLPMIDHPSDKATSEFVITAPERYGVVANGLLVGEKSLGNGWKETHWKQSVPIASWLNALGVEQFAVHHGGTVKGVELQTWVGRQDLDAGVARFEAVARRSIEFYSDFIGPYSYEKMASVSAPFGGGATEHASVIFYGEAGATRAPGTIAVVAPAAGRGVTAPATGGRAAGGGRGGADTSAGRGVAAPGAGGRAAGGGRAGGGRGAVGPAATGGAGGAGGVVSHEIAHHWFGDAVTESDWDDAWLSEGFATYFALLYNEHYAGRDVFINGVRTMFRSAHNAQQSSKLPVIHENIDANDLRGVIPQLVYQKGGAFLHMLRGQIGADNFWAGIRDYYRRHRDGNASTDDLRRSMEEASGQELQWFFTQWLKRTTDPFVTGTWSYDPETKKISLTLTQTQPGLPFRLPFEVAVTSDTTPTPRIEHVEMRQMTQRFEIASDKAPTSLTLDPNSWILMEPPAVTKR